MTDEAIGREVEERRRLEDRIGKRLKQLDDSQVAGFEGVHMAIGGLAEKFDVLINGNGGVGVKVRLDRLEVWRGRKDAVTRVVGTTLIVSACGLPFYLLRLPLMNLIERLL